MKNELRHVLTQSHNTSNNKSEETAVVKRNTARPIKSQQRVALGSLREIDAETFAHNRRSRRAEATRLKEAPIVTGLALSNTALFSSARVSNSATLHQRHFFSASSLASKERADENKKLSRLLVEIRFGWHEVRGILESWSELQEGWDGDDAQPLAPEVIASAKAFIEVAERYSVKEPRPYIASGDEIGFIWDQGRKASVTFLGTDRFLALCPRQDRPDLRVAGPLDISACSTSLFEALQEAYQP